MGGKTRGYANFSLESSKKENQMSIFVAMHSISVKCVTNRRSDTFEKYSKLIGNKKYKRNF